jgi:hypothetical protein
MWLRELVQALVTANTTLPIILDSVAAVSLIVKAATGQGPSVQERAEVIRAAVAANKTYGEAEIARLEAMIAAV